MEPLRIFRIQRAQAFEVLDELPDSLPAEGFLWLCYSREHFQETFSALQTELERLTGLRILNLHISDLLNDQLPSHYDYTSNYDVLIFQQLMNAPHKTLHTNKNHPASLPLLPRQHTQSNGFVLFDQILITVHAQSSNIQDSTIERLKTLSVPNSISEKNAVLTSSTGATRLPDSAAELMLRMVSLIVDEFLNLRKELTHIIDLWQKILLQPHTRFDNWNGLLRFRQVLRSLSEICEDQLSALDRWMNILNDNVNIDNDLERHKHDLIMVRCRDVIEHVKRVLHHVHSLEHSAETIVQIHFNIQSNRTNDVMRTLTAITAIFLPLNLIAGIFGMNFQFIPGLEASSGFWITLGAMAIIGIVLFTYFARKRYLSAKN